MYRKQNHAGNTPDYWEENWESSQFEDTVRFCHVDPLRPLFEKYSEEGSLILEGGCGTGNYLAYYDFRGRRVVGLDFAQKTLKNLHQRQKHLDLCAGDVSRLPFADETFDLYYSGGVVEHFEGGAEKSLEEARRVLKKDGVLLISVPYYSPLRRILSVVKNAEWRKIDKPEVDNGEVFADKRFFQYAYKPYEFQKMLEEAGLKIIEKQGYSIIWGLYDLSPFNSEEINIPKNAGKTVHLPHQEVKIGEIIKEESISLPKRFIVSEDEKIPLLGAGLKFAKWFLANMMMYVCVRDTFKN